MVVGTFCGTCIASVFFALFASAVIFLSIFLFCCVCMSYSSDGIVGSLNCGRLLCVLSNCNTSTCSECDDVMSLKCGLG